MTSSSWNVKRNPNSPQNGAGDFAVYFHDAMSELTRMLTGVGELPTGDLPDGVSMNELVATIQYFFVPFVKSETNKDKKTVW